MIFLTRKTFFSCVWLYEILHALHEHAESQLFTAFSPQFSTQKLSYRAPDRAHCHPYGSVFHGKVSTLVTDVYSIATTLLHSSVYIAERKTRDEIIKHEKLCQVRYLRRRKKKKRSEAWSMRRNFPSRDDACRKFNDIDKEILTHSRTFERWQKEFLFKNRAHSASHTSARTARQHVRLIRSLKSN